jgi:hypothetical protein
MRRELVGDFLQFKIFLFYLLFSDNMLPTHYQKRHHFFFAPGAPHQTPNQEYVKITNKGTTAVNLKGWKIKDGTKKHTYSFPSTYTLNAKATVTIYTGKGTNSATKLYWGSGAFVWNNEGDTAYLYNAQGTLVSSKTGAKVK